MALSRVLFVVALLCALWSVTALVWLTADLSRRGHKTPWPLIGFWFFRNASLYRQITLKEEGRVGPLVKAFVIPINLAWILALIALALR